MKQLLMSLTIIISSLTGTVAFAQNNSGFQEVMIRMFAERHHMTEYQQDLTINMFKSFKSLASEIKKPKKHVKSYVSNLVQADNVDVDLVLQEYREWQKNIDQKFETALRDFAAVHGSLTIDQRQQLVKTFHDMREKAMEED